MFWNWLPDLPYQTAELPGIGGRLKATPEDFVVEEIPAYEPSGQGDYLYLWIEKRDMSGDYFLKQLSRKLRIPREEIGTAGIKDRRAVTRQWISVPRQAESELASLDGEDLKVLLVNRHGNKLRPGHLRGNRFTVRLRDVHPNAAQHLEPLLERLQQRGMINFYGDQRFGRGGETLDLGLKLLRDEINVRDRFLRKLALSAVQSALFNAMLSRRYRDGYLWSVLVGDVMGKLPQGGIFCAEDLVTEQARFDRREIMHQGPMFGTKMYPAQSVAAEREVTLLAEAGLSLKSFEGFGKLLSGTRRHNLVYVAELMGHVQDQEAVLSFTLPAGSYATVLLGEVMKTVAPADSDEAQ